MVKAKKKRNKKYSGADATQTRPTITRVQAVNRGAIGQWLHEHRRMMKYIGIAALVIFVLALVVAGIISLFQ